MRNDTWFKYKIYRGFTILFILLIIIGAFYYSGIKITGSPEIKQVKKIYTSGNKEIEQLEIHDDININPNYRYSFLKISNGIKYYRYYPSPDCSVSLNLDWQITNKGIPCDEDDLKIILHQKNIEEYT